MGLETSGSAVPSFPVQLEACQSLLRAATDGEWLSIKECVRGALEGLFGI
jgi:hypothetical protein